ncbi:RabGAP/TBC [Polyporus arcularius HHB13444]|uniref:RabGAP/TBC n=1 Tax=Polyporus arcularius HHB13444 TaxID=1314778 RepID=A0A5C3PAG9_9APHY|nr:RabGAP/TBC [Polyporus arcularius HHB13444]
MADSRHRPDVTEIKDAYDHLFNSRHKLAKLKDATLSGRLFQGARKGAGVAGRSMAWKLFLVPDEPLQDVADVEAAPPWKRLRASREDYRRLLMEKMRAPDGGYEEGFTVPGSGASPPRTEGSSANLEKNNPLSLHDENPWREWFAAVELRKTILQDVERTFPDITYFRDAEVQAELTNILYLYSDMHPDVGYRQGMHELLAPLYYAVDYDSLSEDTNTDTSTKEFCSRAWVAADAWLLFTAVMKGAGRWYEWQEGKTPADRSPLPSHVQLNVSGDTRVKPYIAPIVEDCNRIQSVFLKGVDPELWKSLQTAGIEPQIYGIRWLRLLFTREFGMEDAMVMWDGLFAVDPTFNIALWICVAMLIRIRNQLIPADYSSQLTYLLRYPADPAAAGGSTESAPLHHATLLLRQALTLQMSPTPTTGVSVIHENKNFLDIPVEVPPPTSPPVHRRPRQAERSRSFTNANGYLAPGEPGGSKGIHNRQVSTPMGIPETFARGLLERGESLGINKTVMNAVSELKRNLPDLSAALNRLPLSPPPANALYPMSPERPTAVERPPWEPRSRREMEREVAQEQALRRKLGDTLGWIVDTLLLDEGDASDDAAKHVVQRRKREALESLAYVRDVLKGTVTEVEDDRLLGEEEAQRRREKERREKEAVAALSRTNSTPHPPRPAAIPIEARPQGVGVRRSQDYFMPHASGSSPPTKAAVPAPVVPPTQTHRPPPITAAPAPAGVLSALSPSLTPKTSTSAFSAPWNYTRSSFSSSDSPIATLPRVPPRTSAVLPMPRAQPLPASFRSPPPAAAVSERPNRGSRDHKPNLKETPYDPLGAIP